MTVKIYSQKTDASVEIVPCIDEDGNTSVTIFTEEHQYLVSVDVSHEDLIELSKYLNELLK